MADLAHIGSREHRRLSDFRNDLGVDRPHGAGSDMAIIDVYNGKRARMMSKYRPRSRTYANIDTGGATVRIVLPGSRREHLLSTEQMLASDEQELLPGQAPARVCARSRGQHADGAISGACPGSTCIFEGGR